MTRRLPPAIWILVAMVLGIVVGYFCFRLVESITWTEVGW